MWSFFLASRSFIGPTHLRRRTHLIYWNRRRKNSHTVENTTKKNWQIEVWLFFMTSLKCYLKLFCSQSRQISCHQDYPCCCGGWKHQTDPIGLIFRFTKKIDSYLKSDRTKTIFDICSRYLRLFGLRMVNINLNWR